MAFIDFLDRPVHPALKLFPLGDEGGIRKLAARLEAETPPGTEAKIEPIMLDGDVIIDGRRRYIACKIANVIPLFAQWEASHKGQDLVLWISDRNFDRRHLTTAEKAYLSVPLLKLLVEEGKARRLRGLKNQPLPEGFSYPDKVGDSSSASREADEESPRARERVAQSAGISKSTIERAQTILDKGVPELVEATIKGEIGFLEGAAIAQLPAEEQIEAVVETVAEGKREKLTRADPVTDANDEEFPEQAIAAVAMNHRLTAACKALDRLIEEIDALGDNTPISMHLYAPSVRTHLKNARQAIWGGRATHVCGGCHGNKSDCGWCHGAGWMNKFTYDQYMQGRKER